MLSLLNDVMSSFAFASGLEWVKYSTGDSKMPSTQLKGLIVQ